MPSINYVDQFLDFLNPPSPHVDFCRHLHDSPFDLHRFFTTPSPLMFLKIFAIVWKSFKGNFWIYLLCQKNFDSAICESKNQASFWCNTVYMIYVDLTSKPPSPLVDEHRYFGNPHPPVHLRSLWTAPNSLS